ncbi:MAG: DUF4013 domain-containing protein [bacterium]
MDIIPFIRFTLNSRYISRWLYEGLMIYIPILNFFSLGYLSKVSRLLMIGGIGLPPWQDKQDLNVRINFIFVFNKSTWIEGVKLIFIFILYEAVPFFLFSSGFFLTTLSNITAFFGYIIIKLSYIALFICSFLLPFAFATFADQMDLRKALEFEKILKGIKEVFIPYLGGYLGTLIALYICKLIMHIPYLIGFILSSILTYYVFLISTYYFTELFKKTTLPTEITGEDMTKSSEQ